MSKQIKTSGRLWCHVVGCGVRSPRCQKRRYLHYLHKVGLAPHKRHRQVKSSPCKHVLVFMCSNVQQFNVTTGSICTRKLKQDLDVMYRSGVHAFLSAGGVSCYSAVTSGVGNTVLRRARA